MHLIIGTALSLLASRKLNSQNSHRGDSPLLRLRGPIETVHVIPGRVRFRVASLVGASEKAQLISETLGKLEGVESIATSCVTGSVVISYGGGALTPELLFTALVRILGLEEDLHKAPRAAVVKEAEEVSRCLNKSLYDGTRGAVDLRGALLLLLLFLGVRKILLERGRALPPGATLLWWAASLIPIL